MIENIGIRQTKKQAYWHITRNLVLLLIVSVVAVLAGQSFENTMQQVTPEQHVFRSVINKKASGCSALLTIAQQSGLPCRLWVSQYRHLNDIKGLLYVVEPNEQWTESEVKEILAWVHQGNQLIYLDPFSHNQKKIHARTFDEVTQATTKKITDSLLLRKLGLSAQWLDNNDVIYATNLPEMMHVNKLLLKSDVKIIGGQPLIACKHGAYITAVKYGCGRILIGSIPELCANHKLSTADGYDNFQFLINCFRTADGAILFDEYCHGMKKGGNVFVYFSRKWPGLLCVQLLFMLIPAELSTRQRFGALKVLKTKRQISDLAYVLGLANVYKRAQANTVALEIIVGFWKAKLCRRLGLSGRATTDEILGRAKDFNESDSPFDKVQWLSNLNHFLSEYEQALSSGEISKDRLIQLISRCDALDMQVR